MKISQTVKKIPGGLMVVPLLLGAIANTFFRNVLWNTLDGTFTTYLWESGAMPILAVFIFCSTTTTSFKKAGAVIYKGMLIAAVRIGVDIIVELICGTLFGEKGFLDLSTLATVGTLTNSNDGLYATLAGEYGDTTDVGAVSILSIDDDPLFIIAALGVAGVAKIPMSILIDCTVPVIVGYVLGSLGEDVRRFYEPSATMPIPFFAFPLGTGLNIMSLLKAGGPGVLLGVVCTPVTGPAGCPVYKLLRMDHPEVGGAIGTTADNTAATPTSVATVDATLLAVAEVVTTQTTAAIIVTTILCPILVSYLHRIGVCKRGR